MRSDEFKLLRVVALTEDFPEAGLVPGQVGTIVEVHSSEVFEVEFSDDDGQTYAQLAIPGSRLIVLHHSPVGVA